MQACGGMKSRAPSSCIATILSTSLWAGSNSAVHVTPTRSPFWRSILAMRSASGMVLGLSSDVRSILACMSDAAFVRPSKYNLLQRTISWGVTSRPRSASTEALMGVSSKLLWSVWQQNAHCPNVSRLHPCSSTKKPSGTPIALARASHAAFDSSETMARSKAPVAEEKLKVKGCYD